MKASGLAAGKGVVVAKDKEEACNAVKMMIQVIKKQKEFCGTVHQISIRSGIF